MAEDLLRADTAVGVVAGDRGSGEIAADVRTLDPAGTVDVIRISLRAVALGGRGADRVVLVGADDVATGIVGTCFGDAAAVSAALGRGKLASTSSPRLSYWLCGPSRSEHDLVRRSTANCVENPVSLESYLCA